MTYSDASSSPSDEDVSGNLPVALSSFVGRDQEVADLVKLLGTARLVTLAGSPGMGKTRLALEVATKVARNYPDGAWLVELAPVADAACVPQAMAAALSVREAPGRSLAETLVAHVFPRQMLLVIDNCEHVITAAAELVDNLLRSCPSLSVLATSREPLSILGEVVWRLPALSVPDAAHRHPEVLADYEAVRLFVERAGTFQPRFALTAEVAPAIGEICRRLDGIPLAIELAAARVEIFTPADIARRLDDRFRLLSGGSRTGLPRHQTLRAAFDWSYELLSAPEKRFLQQISVFAGGFSIDAADWLCEQAGGADDGLDLVVQLVVKSVVMVDTATEEPRYRLPESFRAYARDRLVEAGGEAEARALHARWCLTLGEQAEPGLVTACQQRWLDQLEAEHDNLRLALAWAIGEDQPEMALRLGGALVLFWRVRGYFSEGREWLEVAISATDRPPPALLGKALWGSGFLALMLGEVDAAIPALEKSVSLFRQLGDKIGCARSLAVLGNAAQYRVRSATLEPVSLIEESIVLARDAGDHWCLARALAFYGLHRASRNELDAARPPLEQCLTVAGKAQDKQGLTLGLLGLGSVALAQGDYRAAKSVLEKGVAVASELGEAAARATGLQHLGELALAGGDYEEARSLLKEALALARAVSPAPGAAFLWWNAAPSRILPVPTCLVLLGRVAHAEDDIATAGRLFEEALAAARFAGVNSTAAVHGLGEVAEARGDDCAARRFFEDALALARSSGDRAAVACALYTLGNLARRQGDHERAGLLHNEALVLQARMGNTAGVAASLEAVAALGAETGRCDRAARLLGAADALRRTNGYVLSPSERSCHESGLALVRQRLSPEKFEEAWAAGAALSTEEAVSFATRSRGARRDRPSTGWESLTSTESTVAALVAEGLTNPQIAKRLLMSLGTVKAHLSHIFAKLGVRERGELAREAWHRGHCPPRTEE